MQRGRWDSGRRWDQGKQFWDSFITVVARYAKQLADTVLAFARRGEALTALPKQSADDVTAFAKGQQTASEFPKQSTDSQTSFPKNT